MQRILTILIAAASLAITNPLYAFMDKDASYSATRHIESADGSVDMKIYHAPGKERMEFNAGGQMMTSILRLDRKVAWLLIPQMKAYTESDLSRYLARTPEGYDVVEHKKVGTETVNGYKAVKYHVTFRTRDGATGTGYYWIVNDSIPIKMDLDVTDNGKTRHMTMELTNLKIGPQKASLFEPPAGYRKMSMPTMGSSPSGASSPAMSQPAPGRAAPPPPEQPGVANEIGKAAGDEAKSSTKSEVKHAVGNFVHGLFH